ncbi:ankyrin repeat-containing protein BDA1-like [Daucus carota subsp. sativus]|uniref:ankyrin repeat-containing protein BDA1-like n=1 Tax=Daucus carota subsp. sativus TaxID=79200 RepID=UPI00308276A6
MNTEVMEKKLYDACYEGDVEALEALIQGDKFTLARVSLSSTFNQTPLHLASMLGHVEFVKSLLSYKPDVTKNLDLQGRCALHLASANGYPDIVKLLIEYDENMCRLCDEDGRTPLHLAVFIKGQDECVSELLKVNSESDQERTVLHLCIKYNRLNVLVSILESNDQDFSSIKQDDGNTLIHSATVLGRLQIIKYLVKCRSEVDVNSVNENGLTALDMVEQMPKDVKSKDIREFLISAGALRAQEIEAATATSLLNPAIAYSNRETSRYSKLVKGLEVLKRSSLFQKTVTEKDDTLLIGASVIAAMAYTAAISPPGGVAALDAVPNTEDNPWFHLYYLPPGGSLLAYFWPGLSNSFWIFNTISFLGALTVILLYVSGAMKTRIVVFATQIIMQLTLTAMTAAYLCAVVATSPTYGSKDLSKSYKHNKITLVVSIVLVAWNLIILVTIRKAVRASLHYVKTTIKENEAASNKIYTIEDTATSTTPSNHIV